jgi:oxygen-independent coproporphyrinogen-3 oxidase
LQPNGFTVLPAGRLLVRAICAVFDRYTAAYSQQRFSRVI